MTKHLSSRLSILALLLCFAAGLAYAQEPSGYYKKAEGKMQKALLQQLCEIVGPHTNVGYDGLWNVYKDSDVRPGTNYYWDMYSTAKFPVGQKKCGNYKYVGDCVNREHSFPKSWFDDKSPMVSDAFHIYPTDGKVNGQRSNFPYGECSGGTTLESHNGADALGKLGHCTFPGYSGTVFEPVDEYKGDFARSYFYMAACYNDKISSWSSPMLAGNNYPCFTSWAINLLLKWNEQDPVSQKEIDRNNAVYKHQRNRNPFIDHPELAEYIWGDKQTVAWTPGGVIDPKITSPYNGSTFDMGVTAVNAALTYTVSVKAEGLTQNVAVSVSGAGFKASAASISASDANKGTTLTVTYTSAAAATAVGTLTLTSGTAKSSVTLKAQAVDGIPALPAANVTSEGFTARWTDIDKNGGDYTLSVYLADGTTLVSGYPKTVKAAAQQYVVTGLDYLTEYKYQLADAHGLKSNIVSVTTADVEREISLELPAGGLKLVAAPGVPSEPARVTVYASNIEEDEITVKITDGFQISTDKADWRTELAVDTKTAETIGAEIYVRRQASAAGTYEGTLSAYTATVEGDDADVTATVSAPVTFFEDFEQPGTAPYNTFEYEGSACKWNVVNGGIANRTQDKKNGTQSFCSAKSGDRSLTMAEDKQDGAGTVTFLAAVFGSDEAATVEISYSVDHGSNWIVAKSFAIDDKLQLAECSATLNVAQPVRLRFVQTAGKRVNIDDVQITSFTSSVSAVNVAESWDAYCRDGKLVVETSSEAEIHIYTIDAREAYSTTVSGESAISLPAGYYIVVNGDDSRKVAIK